MMASADYQLFYPEHASALSQALVEDPFYIRIVEMAGDLALLKYLDYSIVEAERYAVACFPDRNSFGVSVWCKPLAANLAFEQKQLKKQFLIEQLGEAYFSTYEKITTFMSAESDAVVEESAWYLSIVGVLPTFQNRGLGVQLVQQVLDKTDQLALPTFLETFTPRNESFYQRLGYRVAARPLEPTLNASYAIMVRESQLAQAG